MKVTIYTVSDCQFSKQEKDYLNTNKIVFEEKNLETNKEFLTEMLAVSNNFAGTPVTKIEKDDGKIEVLKGFTKEEFDKSLNLAPEPTAPIPPAPPAGGPTPPEPPIPPTPSEPTPTPSPSQPEPPPPVPTETPPTPPAETQTNDPLKSILEDLQAKSTTNPSNPLPNVPDFQPNA